MRNIHITIAALASASAIAIAAPAFAQDAPAPEQAAQPADNSDIIVTAQRKAEKVTEVPISITVANAAQLERQQVNTMNDLNRIAPSLEIQQAPGQNTGGGGSIRGIGTQTFSAGAVASVGVVVDQVSQGNANISDLFDVSRIEVLKGSASMLFGKGSTGGVVNQVTKQPFLMDRYEGELSLGSGKHRRVQADLNKQLSSNSAVRLNAMVQHTDNWGAQDNREGVAASWRTGIGERNEFQVDLYHLNTRERPTNNHPWVLTGTGTDVQRNILPQLAAKNF
jgi:iron complex outermembrane receptor protein